jgi:RNA polymerase sigma-70 factor, ECF subfamily
VPKQPDYKSSRGQSTCPNLRPAISANSIVAGRGYRLSKNGLGTSFYPFFSRRLTRAAASEEAASSSLPSACRGSLTSCRGGKQEIKRLILPRLNTRSKRQATGFMPGDSKLSGRPVNPSSAEVSGDPLDDGNPQLSPLDGVEEDVGTAAIDRGVLMGGMGPSSAASLSPALAGATGTSDAEVMLRVKAGDQSAFDYLVQKYRRPLVSFMYRMARNAAAAEDLAQEVFLRVYRSRQTYEASAKFTTWLYRIATNLAVNHARDTRHERPEVTVSLDEPDEETGTTVELRDESLTAEQALMQRERMRAIRSKIEALPEQQRLAVIMHKYQQMDYKQIAEVLKKSESATKSLLFRAYETLREQLKEFL